MSDAAPIHELDADSLLRVLVEHAVDFVVIGGLSLAAHGYVRATKDIDIVPEPSRANRERLFSAMQTVAALPIEIGDFRPEELPVPFTPDGLDHGGNWALQTTFGRIDIMQWVSGVEGFEQLRANAVVLSLPEIGSVAFAGYDDLVAMKRAADRPTDRQDIAELKRLRG